jgi:DNA-binding transcriptional ArsR family regulator
MAGPGYRMMSSMHTDEDIQARARALSSPLRLRILRLCLHKARTNKEIAGILKVNPATALHHVRTLLATGFLRAEEPRTGNRGAREIPYRATGLSWGTHCLMRRRCWLKPSSRRSKDLPRRRSMSGGSESV